MNEEQPRYTAEEWAKFQAMRRELEDVGAPPEGEEAEPVKAVPPEDQPLLIYWSNLISIRFWIAIILGTVLLFAPLAWVLGKVGVPQGVTGWVFWPIAALVLLVGLLVGDALDCPRCGKNIKMGKARCHHCGYDLPAKV